MIVKKVLFIFGTRPEAIKLAPLIINFIEDPCFDVKVCVTAQHRDMLDQVLDIFNIKPDYDLDLMTQNQTLGKISALILEKLDYILELECPNLVVLHGDTTTSSMAAIACFYKKIKIAHVEAGLRTHNINSPWPEEFNRRVTGLIASYHLSPTSQAAENLINEKVDADSICITGNTVIDSLLWVSEKFKSDDALLVPLRKKFDFIDPSKKLILVTGHRRENFGDGMLQICESLRALASRDNVQIVYAVHLNPNVKKPVENLLSGLSNITLIPPQDYLSFIFLMTKSYIILTDSGGIQEEAPSLNKPILIMRDLTERPEVVASGAAILVGASSKNIIDNTEKLLDDDILYSSMAMAENPFGDGSASSKIKVFLKNKLSKA